MEALLVEMREHLDKTVELMKKAIIPNRSDVDVSKLKGEYTDTTVERFAMASSMIASLQKAVVDFEHATKKKDDCIEKLKLLVSNEVEAQQNVITKVAAMSKCLVDILSQQKDLHKKVDEGKEKSLELTDKIHDIKKDTEDIKAAADKVVDPDKIDEIKKDAEDIKAAAEDKRKK